jgi:MFS family permease
MSRVLQLIDRKSIKNLLLKGMKKMESVEKKYNPWLPDFGTKGWGITIFGIFFYFVYMGVFDVGLNVLFPIYEEMYGWGTTQVSSIVSIGGWCALLGIAVFGIVGKKKGAKFTIIIGLAGVAVGFAIVGAATTLALFAIGVIVFFVFSVAFAVIGVGMLGAEWFPRKKGMYMGMTTMGIVLGSATINLIEGGFIGRFGLPNFMYCMGGCMIVLLILVAVFVKNKPEEAGAWPDNDKSLTSDMVAELFRKGEEYRKQSSWTLKKVISTRQTWLIGIGWGIPIMCSTGLMIHLVETMVFFGHDPMFGIILLSVMWPVGVAGNYLGGVIDMKFGPKATTFIIMVIEFAAALMIAFLGATTIPATIAIGMFMFAICANTNMVMSITTSVFGRQDFENAWPVISVIYRVFQSAGAIYMAVLMTGFGPKGALIGTAVFVVIAAIIISFTNQKQIASQVPQEGGN